VKQRKSGLGTVSIDAIVTHLLVRIRLLGIHFTIIPNVKCSICTMYALTVCWQDSTLKKET